MYRVGDPLADTWEQRCNRCRATRPAVLITSDLERLLADRWHDIEEEMMRMVEEDPMRWGQGRPVHRDWESGR